MDKKTTLLSINKLNIEFGHGSVPNKAVDGLSFNLYEGEVLAMVGESGSGKTISCLSILQLVQVPHAKITSTSSLYKDIEVGYQKMTLNDIRKFRGKEIAMVFQEPMSSFNPSMCLGKQVMEAFLIHNKDQNAEAKEATLQLFEKVKLPNPQRIFNAYPHEVSGGQLQRVMIAMALINKPKIILADEPTTALDVTVQHEILKLLLALKNELKLSIIFITHDLSLVKKISDRVIVMKMGKIVEEGDVNDVFNNPTHNYTKGLLACIPTLDTNTKRLPTVDSYELGTPNKTNTTTQTAKRQFSDEDECLIELKNVSKIYQQKKAWFRRVNASTHAVEDVSFNLYKGQILGVVGESGSGKTTLAKMIVGILEPSKGVVNFNGANIHGFNNQERKEYRKQIQYIFQNPYASLNPKMSIGAIIKEPMVVHGMVKRHEAKSAVCRLLEEVGLSEVFFDRYPNELSGGQRQRVVIARALAIKPKILICDECVSALDVSVQATIINLLLDLRDKYDLTYLFISHDLAVVKYISDQVLVMNKGKVEEIVDADSLLTEPKSDYTKQLISSLSEEI